MCLKLSFKCRKYRKMEETAKHHTVVSDLVLLQKLHITHLQLAHTLLRSRSQRHVYTASPLSFDKHRQRSFASSPCVDTNFPCAFHLALHSTPSEHTNIPSERICPTQPLILSSTRARLLACPFLPLAVVRRPTTFFLPPCAFQHGYSGLLPLDFSQVPRDYG